MRFTGVDGEPSKVPPNLAVIKSSIPTTLASIISPGIWAMPVRLPPTSSLTSASALLHTANRKPDRT
ncbi:uncharacterized protein AKAW2_11967A [Aspergillus luchuensis]|uniref:Uncharacterized protein n=1 Tax=Aspergillus kawachii TaxID=1069201 RepID=A0A7R7W269_ASPKA|nr:uncharacterized protein AKAW2_11967A [Aspergillus luchuensis]BCR94921.1 hypothetical protein AKAW2_11967A [Aspergillus luchuensis]